MKRYLPYYQRVFEDIKFIVSSLDIKSFDRLSYDDVNMMNWAVQLWKEDDNFECLIDNKNYSDLLYSLITLAKSTNKIALENYRKEILEYFKPQIKRIFENVLEELEIEEKEKYEESEIEDEIQETLNKENLQ